jgi:hypothetical protein
MLEHRKEARAGAPAPEHLHAAHHELAGPPAALSLEVRLVQIRENAADFSTKPTRCLTSTSRAMSRSLVSSGMVVPTGQRRPLRTVRCPYFV